jgi:HEPN domain-containing protein
MSNQKKSILIEISKEDNEASKILYLKGLYPQSLFFFQQSVEKAVKHLGVNTEIIDPKDLFKKIGHNSVLIFKNATKKYANNFSGENIVEIDSNFNEIKNFIDKEPPEVVVQFAINQIENTLNENLELPFDLDSIETSDDLYRIIKQFFPDNPEFEKLKGMSDISYLKPIVKKMIEKFKTGLPKYIQSTLILFIFSCIVTRHVSSVRYPNVENMTNPSEYYSNENPLIFSLPTFQKMMDFILNEIQNFY